MSDLGIYNLYERTNPGTIETFQKRTASKMDLQTEYEKIIEDTEWIDLMELIAGNKQQSRVYDYHDFSDMLD